MSERGGAIGKTGWMMGFLAACMIIGGMMTEASAATPVDASTLHGKLIFGYQGWFGCPGDAGGRGWVHWKAGTAVTVDLLPDVSELGPDELCDSGMTAADGKKVNLFSSQNPKTVDRHFAWMEQYGLDGVAVQKFATILMHPELGKASEIVIQNVRAAAERHGRLFFLMYDLSGMPQAELSRVTADWARFIAAGLTTSPAYLHHKGRVVLGLWGLGFNGRDMTPTAAADFIDAIRRDSQAAGGVTIVGGVPGNWREGKGDASPDPGWKAVWPKIDVISPWTVGRYTDDAGIDNYAATILEPDMAYARELHVEYMPVIFPGFSWANLQIARHNEPKAIFNQIPRRCGAFYWRQAYDDIHAGATMIYNAMFDEVDEGTAMFKVVTEPEDAPADLRFVTLDADGCHAGSDLYLRLGGAATEGVRRGKLDEEILVKSQ